MSANQKKEQISIVIPTIGRDRILVDTLLALEAQNDVVFEVIIVNQNDSVLPTLKEYLVQSKLNIKHLNQKEKNASKARNKGANDASSSILLFLDDDVIIHDNLFLRSHLKNYENDAISGVAGQILAVGSKERLNRHAWSKSNYYGWLYFPLNFNERITLGGVGAAANLSVRKKVFFAVGGMDENFEKGAFREESDFIQRCNKSGYALVFDPKCSLVHIGDKTGGIRSWGQSVGLQQMHHVVGEWYFTIKHINKYNYFHFLIALIRRQVLNRANVTRPHRLFQATCRSLKGLLIAYRVKLKGEKILVSYRRNK